jgi:hypothetical protein
MSQFLSTRQVADLLQVDAWRIQRIYEDGTLTEPPRFAGKRVIQGSEIPAIIDALRLRGWLPELEAVACHG